eukprot:264456-Chlamydomonas_euryale.AAC.8
MENNPVRPLPLALCPCERFSVQRGVRGAAWLRDAFVHAWTSAKLCGRLKPSARSVPSCCQQPL